MAKWLTCLLPPRRGTRHIADGVPCQDSAVVLENEERIVAVVSDGVSMCRHSEYAAQAAARAAAEFLLGCSVYGNFRDMKYALIDHCRAAVIRCAGVNNLPMSELDCTLLFVLLWRDGSRVVTGQLGDGAICALTEREARLLEAPDMKRYSGANFTNTLFSTDAVSCMSVMEWANPDEVAFLLTTDGLEKEIYFRSSGVHRKAEWYVNLIAAGDEQSCQREIGRRWDTLAADADFGFTDDMSLAAIVQAGASVKLPQDPNWLCICGARNRLESTLCNACDRDFLQMYRGVRFKDAPGGKAGFFAAVNQDEAEEWRVLREHCRYPMGEAAEQQQPSQPEGMQTEAPPAAQTAAMGGRSGASVQPQENASPAESAAGAVPAVPVKASCEEQPEPVSRHRPVEAETDGPALRGWLGRHWQNCCVLLLLAALAAVSCRCAWLSAAYGQLNARMHVTEQEYETVLAADMQVKSLNTDLQQELEKMERGSAALRAELERLSKSLAAAEAEGERLETENTKLRRELAAMNADANRKETELQQLRGQVAAMSADAGRKETELQQLKGRVEFLTGDNAALGAEINRLIGEMQQLQAECDRLRLQAEAQAVPSGGDPAGDMQEMQAETTSVVHPAET